MIQIDDMGIAGCSVEFYDDDALPVITQQPVNVIAAIGQSATFSVKAESVKPVSYQWYKSADSAMIPMIRCAGGADGRLESDRGVG